MKNLLILFTFLLVVPNFGFGETGLTIFSENYTYKLESLDTYTSLVEVEGINATQQTSFIAFPVGELAEVISIEVYELIKDKWKASRIKNEVTISTMSWSAFFTGTKKYIYSIPAGVVFRFVFKTAEKNSIFLTEMQSKGQFDAASVSYHFFLPENLELSDQSGGNFEGEVYYRNEDFKEYDELFYVIHPKNRVAIDYFSEWFNERIEPQLAISETVIPDELVAKYKLETKKEFAKNCFRFVQDQIKYIDIENGINAVIPRHSEKVLKNGMGDCKDMATLLCGLYRYFGFEAYPAISRTNSKSKIFDFPSVGLANHMICVLRLDEEWYFLDPTEEGCLFGDPSIQILNTEVFLVGGKGNYFLSVPDHPRSETIARLEYRIDKETDSLYLTITSEGKLNSNFYYLSLKRNDKERFLEQYFSKISGVRLRLKSFAITPEKSILFLEGKLGYSNYAELGQTRLYHLTFVPKLEDLCLILQNNNIPLFDCNLEIGFNFSGKMDLQQEFSTTLIETKKEERNDIFLLHIKQNEDQFELLKREWSTFLEQPKSIEYVKK